MNDAARTKRAITMMAKVSEHAQLERIRQLEKDLTTERTERCFADDKATEMEMQRDQWCVTCAMLLAIVVCLCVVLMAQIGGGQ